jgi:hypothetical protein
VTLVLTVNGFDSIWLPADRRISYKDHAPKDDAGKVMFLDTTDGVAILGYAGLGATTLGSCTAKNEKPGNSPRLSWHFGTTCGVFRGNVCG